jgi:endonuclease/exonuclease/phosphatase family metal-dependent hydrolase
VEAAADTTPPVTGPAPGGPRRPRWANRGWLVAGGALVTWMFVVTLRVWLPSLLHVYGESGVTPAAARGLFATAWFVPAALLVLALPRIGPRPAWRAAVAVLVLARVVLQFTPGGAPQLVTSGVAVAAGAAALVALAAGSPSGHLARVGIVLGLGLEAATHTVAGTYDLVWRPGALAAVLAIGSAVTVLLVAERAARVPLWWPTPLDDGTLSAVWMRGAAWSWLGVGPAIALVGILVSPAARLDVAGDVGPRGAVVLLAVATAAAFAAAALAPLLGARRSGTTGAIVVLGATVTAVEPAGVSSVLAQLGLLVGVGFALGAPTSPRDDGPRRRGAAVVVSLLLFVGITFVYYAAYEVALPVDNDVVLVVGAAVLAVLAFAAARDPLQLRPTRAAPLKATVVTTVAVVIGGLVVVPLTAPEFDPDPSPGNGREVRVATYNVRSGFGADGRFDPDALAAVVTASDADVVVLNEVDRGWLLEGGHDLLRLLATRTGMRAVFAPAADELWGNAVLTRLPVTETRVVDLPRAGAAMQRSLLSVVIDAGSGRSFAVIGTQLHDVDDEPSVRLTQARAVTAEVARLRGRQLPVAVLGDLGAERDAPELAPLAILDDAAPASGPTWPSDDPTVRRDHALVSSDLDSSDPSIPRVTASDHLPIAVTLTLPARTTASP